MWFSPGTPVFSTNKTDCHDITEILLKVELKHDKHNLFPSILFDEYCKSTFIRWHQFSWFLKNAVILGFLNSCFKHYRQQSMRKLYFVCF